MPYYSLFTRQNVSSGKFFVVAVFCYGCCSFAPWWDVWICAAGGISGDWARSAVAFEGGGIDIVQPFAEMSRADDFYGTAAGKKRHDEVVGYT